jgi:hypothetical protein
MAVSYQGIVSASAFDAEGELHREPVVSALRWSDGQTSGKPIDSTHG